MAYSKPITSIADLPSLSSSEAQDYIKNNMKMKSVESEDISYDRYNNYNNYSNYNNYNNYKSYNDFCDYNNYKSYSYSNSNYSSGYSAMAHCKSCTSEITSFRTGGMTGIAPR
jgi:hypothetical protein